MRFRVLRQTSYLFLIFILSVQVFTTIPNSAQPSSNNRDFIKSKTAETTDPKGTKKTPSGGSPAPQSISNPTWTQISTTPSPSSRTFASMAYDGADGYVLLFGGEYGNTGVLSESWEFQGRAWTQLSPSSSPPARSKAAITYDAADGYVLLFGGSGSGSGSCGSYLADTWKFAGGSWTQLSPSTHPSAREGARMAYDAADGYVVLFGGTTNACSSGAGLSDTWEFRSGSWSQLSPGSFPSARYDEGLTYDSADGYVLFFGGWNPYGACGNVQGDTWQFKGGVWTQLSPSSSPSARQEVGLSLDGSLGHPLLYGGWAGTCGVSRTYYQDTWEWIGGSWTQLLPSSAPAARGGHGMTFDSADGYTILQGGFGVGSYLADTWGFSAAGMPTPNSYFQNITSTVYSEGTLGPCCWVAQSLYTSNAHSSGYLTVGGNGFTYYNGTPSALPSIASSGFLTGAAWDSHEFLLVGQHYSGNNPPSGGGVIMYMYDPLSASLTNLTSMFPQSLSKNATLLETAWNGSTFFLLNMIGEEGGPLGTNTGTNRPLNLLAYYPTTNSLENLTSLLPSDFQGVLNSEQAMSWTPNGLFLLLQTANGAKFGVLRGLAFSDLSSKLPAGFLLASNNGQVVTRFGYPLSWNGSALYLGGKFADNSIAIFVYNPTTNQITNYSSLFSGFSGTLVTLTSSMNAIFISGFHGTPNSIGGPLLVAFNLTTNQITDLSSYVPSTFGPISTTVSNGQTLFLAGGVFGKIQYGLLNVLAAETTPRLVFNDEFAGLSLDTSRWWTDSAVLSSIAKYESSVFNQLAVSVIDPSVAPLVNHGVEWTAAGHNGIFGITSMDAFIPSFKVLIQVTPKGATGGNPVSIYLTNGDSSTLFALFLGNVLVVQDQGSLTQTSMVIQMGVTYSLSLSVSLSQVTVEVSGGGSQFSGTYVLATTSDFALYISLATFAGQLPGIEPAMAVYSDQVLYNSVEVNSISTWSLAVTLDNDVSGVAQPVPNWPINLNNSFAGLHLTLNTNSLGQAFFRTLPTGIYTIAATLTQTIASKDYELSNTTTQVVGNPNDPSVSQIFTTIKIDVPKPAPLSVNMAPTTPLTGMIPLQVTLVATPFGGTGQYALTWYLDNTALAPTGGSISQPSCSPDATGEILSCSFMASGIHSVFVKALTTGDWFGTPLQEAQSSSELMIYVNPYQACANIQPAGPGSGTLIISLSSPECTSSGKFTIDGGVLTLHTTVADTYPGSIQISTLPDWLINLIGISYPWYSITLNGVETGYMAQLDDSQQASMAFPPGTSTDPNSLRGLQFTIAVDPWQARALVNDLVIAFFAALGVYTTLKDACSSASQCLHIMKDLLQAVVIAVASTVTSKAVEFASSKDPISLIKTLHEIMWDIIWPGVTAVLQVIGPAILKTLKLDSLASKFLFILKTLTKVLAVAAAVFDATAIFVTLYRGAYSQKFIVQDTSPLTTISTTDPGYVIPSVTADYNGETSGWQNGWINQSGSFLHSTYTPTAYSFAIPTNSFTLNVAAPPNASSNYAITVAYGVASASLNGILSPGQTRSFKVSYSNNQLTISPNSEFFSASPLELLASTIVIVLILGTGVAVIRRRRRRDARLSTGDFQSPASQNVG